MLVALKVQALAIIDALEIDFGPELTVLSGETGAGKSILVDALHLALGGRALGGVVRTGADEASVEALFAPEDPASCDARLAALGLPTGGAELVVRRLVAAEGRSRAYINGALASAAQLAQVTRGLVDISGQHEHVSLLDTASHLGLLDAHAGLAEDRAAYDVARAGVAVALAAAERLDVDETARARRIEELRFCQDEIDALEPRPDEETQLAAERRVLASAGKLQEAASIAEALVYSGDQAAVGTVGRALGRVREAAVIDAQLRSTQVSLESALVELTEAGRTLGAYMRQVAADPERLATLEERLAALMRLFRKHAVADAAALLAKREAFAKERAELTAHEEHLATAQAEVKRQAELARQLGKKLSVKRRAAAKDFTTCVLATLADLDMKKTQLAVEFTPAAGLCGDLGPRGLEDAELLLSPNPGEALRPLARIASGGELSRVLLAVKSVLAGIDPVDTYVFDEADAGIGGPTGDAVGRALSKVAQRRQVLAITHLPQIAAYADAHLSVDKVVAGGRTSSRMVRLQGEARVSELARMLGGSRSPAALAHAQELLDKAEAHREKRRGKRPVRAGRAAS